MGQLLTKDHERVVAEERKDASEDQSLDDERSLSESVDLEAKEGDTVTTSDDQAGVGVALRRLYLNRNTSESFNRSLGSAIEFRLSVEDFKQPWFFRLATRGQAHEFLRNAASGCFLIRPSSHRGLYALSWIKGGEIRDNIIYCQFPGYSLKKHPKDGEKYSSLSSLVKHCPFLKQACPARHDEKVMLEVLQKRVQVFLTEVMEHVRRDTKGNFSLEWELCILESLDTYQTPELCEKRTCIRQGKKESVFPELFFMQPRHASHLANCLIMMSCRVTRLCLNGFEGLARHNFVPLLTDDSFSLICKSLLTNQSLKHLDVRCNNITDVGAESLAELLAHNGVLNSLDVGNNFMTCVGLGRVARGLRRNRGVEDMVAGGQLRRDDYGMVQLQRDDQSDLIIGAMCNALQRRKELRCPTEKGTYRLHGFMEREDASRLLMQVVPLVPGLYLLYLHKNRCDQLQLAHTVAAADGKVEAAHRSVYRVDGGYTLTPREECAVPSLTRMAAWSTWSHYGSDDHPALVNVSDDVRQHIGLAKELFYLWRCEDVLDSPKQKELDSRYDVVTHPNLLFLLNVLKQHGCRIGLNKK